MLLGESLLSVESDRPGPVLQPRLIYLAGKTLLARAQQIAAQRSEENDMAELTFTLEGVAFASVLSGRSIAVCPFTYTVVCSCLICLYRCVPL